MKAINRTILKQVIGEFSEAVLIVHLGHNDWPVVLANRAFFEIGGEDCVEQPFADVIEQLLGRDLALEISETLRSRQETSYPITLGSRELLLKLKPLALANEPRANYYAVFFRGGASGAAAAQETQHALLNAKRRIRDLTRDDPVTGLLNEKAFRDVLDHDWAVAAREKTALALVLFTLDDFSAYVDVFGPHAAESCLRRVGQAVRRCLRRASDVVARLEGARLVVLSHAANEDGVHEFAKQISRTVRDLGLHHPRSSSGRFVTVTQQVVTTTPTGSKLSATDFLEQVILADADIEQPAPVYKTC
ncbi:MAG TPA: GGDEF domain-containing protein [Woeseiaceae bacterium]|nr:GGDEF domain-containing protein [Woeseiaceae bacterium]